MQAFEQKRGIEPLNLHVVIRLFVPWNWVFYQLNYFCIEQSERSHDSVLIHHLSSPLPVYRCNPSSLAKTVCVAPRVAVVKRINTSTSWRDVVNFLCCQR